LAEINITIEEYRILSQFSMISVLIVVDIIENNSHSIISILL